MIASLRADALKMRKRWANWILFGILMLVLLLFGYVLTYIVVTHPPRNFASRVPASVLKREVFPENLLADVLQTMSTIGAAIMIIFGGLSTASEFGWLTVQTILIQKPGRTAVLVGKLIDLAIVTFLVSVVVLAAAAFTSWILANIDGSSSAWPSTVTLLKGFGALWLETSVWTAFGMFLGVAFRSTAGAIGGGLTYLFVGEALIGRLFRDTTGVKEILKFLPGVNAGGVNATFPLTFRNPDVTAQLVDATRGTITLLAYVAVFAILAILIFQRRDVGGS
jgi:ABC-2 type transport system permease protein